MIKYLFYVLKHKWYVLIECWKDGLFWHGITHDLSKFLPSEFIPYARWFYGEYGKKFNGGFMYEWRKAEIIKENFNFAVSLHYRRNKHHWNHWMEYSQGSDPIYCPELSRFPKPMPIKYIRQMICDWKGMAKSFGDTWQDYYIKNKDSFILHKDTKFVIERMLRDDE